MYPKVIQELIELSIRLLPGVGPRQATRFIFGLMRKKPTDVKRFGEMISSLPQRISMCQQCYRSIEAGRELCDTCRSTRRDQKIIMVVEKESDLEAIEKAGGFDGTYHVLNGTLTFFDAREDKSVLHIKDLKERMVARRAKEIILALSLTPEGEATTLYLQKELTLPEIKITRIGRGLSTGSEIEYADSETLKAALEKRG